MATTPRGMTITEAYRLFRNNKFVVNRAYQRKLVWTVEEKARLIDSILKGFPIPLVLLLQRPDGKLEVIDGMQRLNAILTFIENGFCTVTEKFFDVQEFPTARQFSESALFKVTTSSSLLSGNECALILDYQLAVTIFSVDEASDVTEIFGRINSGGRQLSAQEQRQAGVIAPFPRLIRTISSEIRGDTSPDIVNLAEMPMISIDAPSLKLGYGVHSESTFWCRQGILRTKELRESADEQVIADIAISILLESPLNASRERLDEAYDPQAQLYQEVHTRLSTYGERRLSEEIKAVFALLAEIVESVDPSPNALRNAVNPTAGGNPIRTPFYALFMALHKLAIQDRKQPHSNKGIMSAIVGLARSLNTASHHITVEDRRRNIDLTLGLIQPHFVHKEPPLLGHGIGLAVDFENSLRRSKIETPRYEFKQGVLRLDGSRSQDDQIIQKIAKTACAIANIGPDSCGYIYIGVADNADDAARIKSLDGVVAQVIDEKHVVGIDREARQLRVSVEQWVRRVVDKIRTSGLSEPLLGSILTKVDTVSYRGLSVVRLTIPSQTVQSWVGERTFDREGSETVEAEGKRIAAIASRFS
jgi:hypothetical protein